MLQYHSKYKFGELIYESIVRNHSGRSFQLQGETIHESGGYDQDEVIKIKFNKAVNAESFKLSGQYDFSFIMVPYDATCAYRDARVQVMFSHKMDENSIYYSEE